MYDRKVFLTVVHTVEISSPKEKTCFPPEPVSENGGLNPECW